MVLKLTKRAEGEREGTPLSSSEFSCDEISSQHRKTTEVIFTGRLLICLELFKESPETLCSAKLKKKKIYNVGFDGQFHADLKNINIPRETAY